MPIVGEGEGGGLGRVGSTEHRGYQKSIGEGKRDDGCERIIDILNPLFHVVHTRIKLRVDRSAPSLPDLPKDSSSLQNVHARRHYLMHYLPSARRHHHPP